jgi:hypothetical protein
MSRRNTRQARPRIRSRVAVIIAGVTLLSWAGPGANAFWASVANGGSASAAADAVAAGATPSAAVSAGNVTLAWKAAATLAGRPASGYTVARYASASGGTKIAAAGTCTGTVTAGLGCTDQGVPTGTWYYTVTPVLAQWQGSESVRSAGAAVDTTPPAAPTVTAPTYVNSTNVTSVPVSGTTEPGASVALAVTDAGAAHTVTATVTANGSGGWDAAVNLSALNAGTLKYSAVATDTSGNQGNPATPGTAFSSKDVTVPTVTEVSLANGGTKDGKIEPKDKVTITFSEPLDSSTICSSWTAGADGTVSGDQVTVTITPGTGGSGNVLNVTVGGSACPTWRIGAVGLGTGTSYASGTVTYQGIGTNSSIVSWTEAGKTLTITLGALASGSPANANISAAAPSYTPANGMKDVAGNSLATAKFTSATATRF